MGGILKSKKRMGTLLGEMLKREYNAHFLVTFLLISLKTFRQRKR